MAPHSNIVGGSTAKRVIACPASVKLAQQMPPKPSSKYADEGTLLHNIMDAVLMDSRKPEEFIGAELNGVVVTAELIEAKVLPALAALDEIDPDKQMEYECETIVSFGEALPDVFGSADLIGRKVNRAIVLDFKFGDGVDVERTRPAKAHHRGKAEQGTQVQTVAGEKAVHAQQTGHHTQHQHHREIGHDEQENALHVVLCQPRTGRPWAES